MKKIPRTDPRAAKASSDTKVDRAELDAFLADKHQWVLMTVRRDGRPQLSLVTGGLMADGRLGVASYPSRAKVRNARRHPDVSVLVMGNQFNDYWVQVDGRAEVLDVPAELPANGGVGDPALDGFVEYFRCISGEHSDWSEYRQAMVDQGKSLVAIEITGWGPVSKGGFPPSMFED